MKCQTTAISKSAWQKTISISRAMTTFRFAFGNAWPRHGTPTVDQHLDDLMNDGLVCGSGDMLATGGRAAGLAVVEDACFLRACPLF